MGVNLSPFFHWGSAQNTRILKEGLGFWPHFLRRFTPISEPLEYTLVTAKDQVDNTQ